MTALRRLSGDEIVRARARFDIIAAEVALKRKGRELAGLCPFHKEKSPSFYVAPDKGFFHCFGCGSHGTALDYMMRTRGLSFVDAVHEINGTALRRPRDHAPPSDPGDSREPRRDSQGDVDEILADCEPVDVGTSAHLYLQLRGLLMPLGRSLEKPSLSALASLRAHPSLYCYEAGHPLPALVAPITSSSGVTAVQRIWVLDRVEYDGGSGPKDSRAPLRVRKKTLGEMLDGAVRLGAPKRKLGLAEGVETAIAAALLNRGFPVWATCGAARLGRVGIPEGVEDIVIYSDNGKNGEALANRAAEIYAEQGFAVEVKYPNLACSDFNDELLQFDRRGSVWR